MSIYDYHDNPQSLKGYEDRNFIVPKLAYDLLLSQKLSKADKLRALNTIATDAEFSLEYAKYVLKGRFKLGEVAIGKHPVCAYYYAKDIIYGKWRVGENIIATDCNISYVYARDVIKARFPKGEKLLMASHHANRYRNFLQKNSKKESPKITQLA